MSGNSVGISSFIIVIAMWAIWFFLLKKVKIPRVRSPFVMTMLLGITLAIVALTRDPGVIGEIAAVVAILMGGIFIVFRMQSALEKKTSTVAVGKPILDFTALDDQGRTFELASLRGRPFLLKFFRGHW